MRPPSDIELAKIRRLCSTLGAAFGGQDPAIALCAAEIAIASLLVEADVEVTEFMEGVGRIVERMKETSSTDTEA